MKRCSACGARARKFQRAIVLIAPGDARRGLVCTKCAKLGWLLVFGEIAPPDVQKRMYNALTKPLTPRELERQKKRTPLADYLRGTEHGIALLALVLAALVSACSSSPALQASTRLAIAPSAEPYAAAIIEAQERVNAAAGADVFTVHAVAAELERDGEAVIRVGTCSSSSAAACTRRTPDSVAIHLATAPELLSVHALAHELGHAAGLGHSDDPDNLMYPEVATGWQQPRWELTAEQLEQLQAAAP